MMNLVCPTNSRIAVFFAVLAFAGCARLFDEEYPVGPSNDFTDTTRCWDSTGTGDQTLASDGIIVYAIPSRMLFSPHFQGAWSLYSGRELYLIDPHQQLLSHILSRATVGMGFQWISASPNGMMFAFTSQDSVASSGGWEWRPVLYTSTIDGASLSPVPSAATGFVSAPSIAPTGRIAYRAGDPASGEELWVDGSKIFYAPEVMLGTPVWTESDDIIIPLNPMNPANQDYPRGIYRIRPADGHAEVIVSDTSGFYTGFPILYYHGVSTSRSGKILFFTVHEASVSVWLMSPDDMLVRFIKCSTNREIVNGVIDAAGLNFAYADYQRNAVFLVDIESRVEVKILEPYGTIAWVPN